MSILENYVSKTSEEVASSPVPYLMYPHVKQNTWAKLKTELPALKEYDPVLAHRADIEGKMGARILSGLTYVLLKGERFWSDHTQDNSILNPQKEWSKTKTEWRIQAGLLIEADAVTPFTVQVKKQWCQGFRPAAEALALVSTDDWYARSPDHKATKDMPPNFRFVTTVTNIDIPGKSGPNKGKLYKGNTGAISVMTKNEFARLAKWAKENEDKLKLLDEAYLRKVSVLK